MAALEEIDADVFGLIEIQNDEGEATEQIVDALNAATAPGTFDYIDTGFTGTDVIRQAFVYNTTTVSPVGAFDLLDSADDPRFDDGANRPTLIPDLRGELHRRADHGRGQPPEEQGLRLRCRRRLAAGRVGQLRRHPHRGRRGPGRLPGDRPHQSAGTPTCWSSGT